MRVRVGPYIPIDPTTELKQVGESQQTGSHHCQPRRRRLAFAKTDAWSDSEQIALVEFILLHKPGRRWPAEQDPRFWDSAAEYMYVAMRSKRLYNIIIYTRYNYAKNAILSRDFANASCLLGSLYNKRLPTINSRRTCLTAFALRVN